MHRTLYLYVMLTVYNAMSLFVVLRILRRFHIRLQEPPSAALVSVLLALSFCDSVSLYGNTTSGKDFHYNQVKPLHFRNRQNKVEDESHLLLRLHNQGDIKLVGFCKDS